MLTPTRRLCRSSISFGEPPYHAPDGKFYATAGRCTHEAVHLADGLVMDYVIECPKHNGQFDYRTGEAKRAPVCINLKTYPVKVEGTRVFIEV